MKNFLYPFLVIFFFPCNAKEYYKLADFGKNGRMIPTLFGDPPSANFFQNTFQMAIERQLDYHLEIDLVKNPGTVTEDHVLYLTLINDSEMINDLCLSVQDLGQTTYENFLIAIKPFDIITISVSGYPWASLLRMVSTQDFSVNISENDPEELLGEFHKALPPSQLGDHYSEATGSYFKYCAEIDKIQLVVEHSSGDRVMAWFKRFLRPGLTAICQPSGIAIESYGIEVFWPDSMTKHHESNGSAPACPDLDGTPIPRGAKCVKLSYSTTSIIDETTLLWEHLNGPYSYQYFDDVLFASECGRAVCNRHDLRGKCCKKYQDPATQDICIEPDDWFWYIYKPELEEECSLNYPAKTRL